MKFKLFLGTSSLFLLINAGFALPMAKTQAGPGNVAQSDKYEPPCTGRETSGHCADKCPNQGDTLLGYDPVTFRVICQPKVEPVIQQEPLDAGPGK